MKDMNMNEKIINYEITSSVLEKNYAQGEKGDIFFINDGRGNISDIEKKLLFHEKASESQLKVIGNLQDEIETLRKQYKMLVEEAQAKQGKKYSNYNSVIWELLNDKLKDYEMKIQYLECDLFLAELMVHEKNKIIQMFVHKLHMESGMPHTEHKFIDSTIFSGGVMNRKFGYAKYFNELTPNNIQMFECEAWKENASKSLLTLQKCAFCNKLMSTDVPDITDKLCMEIKALKSTLSAKEKVIGDQQEMLRIQQETLIMTQDEVKELQSQLKRLESYNEDESKVAQEQHMIISNLHQDLMTAKQQLEELQSRSFFDISFEKDGEKNCVLQSKNLDLASKFQEAKKYWNYLLKQVKVIELEVKNYNPSTKLIKIIMTIKTGMKHFYSKYLLEEDQKTILDDSNTCFEECTPLESVHLLSNNEFNEAKREINVQDSAECDYSEREEENHRFQNNRNMNIKSDVFKNMHLDEFRKSLNAQVLQEKRIGRVNSYFALGYGEALSYCNYMEHEINKLQDLLVDFQWQMNINNYNYPNDHREQIDISDALTKAENLEVDLNESCVCKKKDNLDCWNHQTQQLSYFKQDDTLQENFREKEKYGTEIMYQVQEENIICFDTLRSLSEEVDLLQLELNERDCQLQNTVSSLQDLSSESSVLHKELQKQEKNVEKLEEQLLQNNIKLQQALSYLDEKNNLLHKLNKENSNIQDRLKDLEIKFQNNMASERYAFLQEISSLKMSIQQLKKLYGKNNMDVREHWWWDDNWQMW